MGAVTFSIDERLLEILQNNGRLDAFVETGTFKGDSALLASKYAKNVYSVEWSEKLYAEASDKLRGVANIALTQGTSPNFLMTLKSRLAERQIVYFLDAHWCVHANTAGEESQCPLLEELKSIGSLKSRDIVIIDDARLFLCSPPAPHHVTDWPKLHDIITALQRLSASHRLAVCNDMILFYPEDMETLLSTYAINHGIDWLHIMHQNRAIQNEHITKEHFFAEQRRLIQLAHEKDALIHRYEAIFQSSASLSDIHPGFISEIRRLNHEVAYYQSLSNAYKVYSGGAFSQLKVQVTAALARLGQRLSHLIRRTS